MAAYEISRRRRIPSMNRRRRVAIIREYDSEVATIVARITAHHTERFRWSRSFPTGKPNLRQIGRIDRLIIGRMARLGVESDLINEFMMPLIEAITNAIQHSRCESRFLLELDVRCSPEGFLIKATVTNRVPPTRRLAFPKLKRKRLTRRGMGGSIMAAGLVDRYVVELKNGDFYRVVMTKLVGRAKTSN